MKIEIPDNPYYNPFLGMKADLDKGQSGLYPMMPFVKYDISVKKYDSGFSVYLHYETPQLKLL
jgi:hypothetical protein